MVNLCVLLMIKSNLGKIERGVRLALAIALTAWVAASDSFGVAQTVGLIAAFALLWNSIFARCYLWKWLGIDTGCRHECEADSKDFSDGSRV